MAQRAGAFTWRVGGRVAAGAPMEVGQEGFIQRMGGEFPGLHGLLKARNALAQPWG
jgi:hypothetical protein